MVDEKDRSATRLETLGISSNSTNPENDPKHEPKQSGDLLPYIQVSIEGNSAIIQVP